MLGSDKNGECQSVVPVIVCAGTAICPVSISPVGREVERRCSNGVRSIAQLLHTTWPVGRVKPGYAVQSIIGATEKRRLTACGSVAWFCKVCRPVSSLGAKINARVYRACGRSREPAVTAGRSFIDRGVGRIISKGRKNPESLPDFIILWCRIRPVFLLGGDGNMTDQQDKNRIDYLDYMRIFAFLSVLIGHLFNVKLAALANDPTLHLTLRQLCQFVYDVCFAGAAGVVVFFFTSGYIITHVLQKEGTGEFIVRRIFRIYPLYVIAVLSEVVVTHTVMNVPLPSLGELVPKLLLIGDFFSTPYALGGVEWTLRVEVLFYAFMAVLKGFGMLDRPRMLPWLLGVTTLCLFIAGPFPNWAGWTNGYLNIFGPFLFIGVLVYLIEKNLANRYVCAAIIFGIYVLSLLKTSQYNVTLKESNYALLALVLFLGGWLMRKHIVGNSITKTLSEMTYAVYLFHLWSWGYLEIVAVKLGLSGASAKVFQLVLLFIICYAATKTIEKYGIKAGRTLLARYRTQRSAPVSA